MNAVLQNSVINNNCLTHSNLILKNIDINVFMQGLMAQTEIVQTYANEEEFAIEAVYTFPLPLDAVLLELDVEIDGIVSQGAVSKKQQALEQYEEAIVQGDTAIMLEKVDEGLFTLNLGNLLAGQKATITMIYSQLHSWMNNELRYHLPTVIAQRYGTPSMEPQQLPETDIRAQYSYHFSMRISGLLSKAQISSPSHKINIQAVNSQNLETKALETKAPDEKNAIDHNEIKLLTISQPAYLDRDLIINFSLQQTSTGSILIEKDNDSCAAIASFRPVIEIKQPRKPKALKILIDCSGSMSGDSIELAKIALILALGELKKGDYFSVFRFGSTTQCMTKSASSESLMMQATPENLIKIKRQLRFIDADLGGTEIFHAIDEALALKTPGGISTDIFLITDGEVWSEEQITPYAGKISALKQRVFTIGVGSAVSTQLVTEIAEKTGGACELLAPNENMADKIQRHFKRIFMPRLENISINWGADVLWQDNNKDLFSGDTYHVYARLKQQAGDTVTLTAEYDHGEVFTQHVGIESIKDDRQNIISRMVVQKHLKQIENMDERADLAVEYQLMDETTAYIIVKQNNAANQSLPEMRKVPQMMAAGQAGFGSEIQSLAKMDSYDDFDDIDFCCEDSIDSSMNESEDLKYLEIPAFLSRSFDKPRKSKAADHERILLFSITNGDLSKELIEILLNSGISFIGDLVQMSEYELQNNPGISDKMIDELRDFVSSLGYTLGMKLDNWPPEND